ncbi:helix-turn-helix transcriptional regulator [Methylobacterium radiotolerans]|uniref:helix-turn-helix transcriptional regulator n=1 Tax=Methylobacterium radiotolerans TaxID=31998 RepID=UPI0015F53108|nr:helix-turn-helix domain-containing protein [Methylobacterium radiotolerans]
MQSLTIPEWCARHKLSRQSFYNLARVGKAPRFMKVGRSVRISEAADAEWLRAREAEAVKEAA